MGSIPREHVIESTVNFKSNHLLWINVPAKFINVKKMIAETDECAQLATPRLRVRFLVNQ